MTAPLFVVYNLDLEGDRTLDICCYTPSHEETEGALEEYASQWLAMKTGVQNEDALDDERNISSVGRGFHLRFIDGTLYPEIAVYRVERIRNFKMVRRFGFLNVNKWKEDYLDETKTSTRITAILAPWRFCCLITPKAELNT